jgi:hypothetical protein
MLVFKEKLNEQEKDMVKHTKKYVRELKQERLVKFVRFCTGSDLKVAPYIQVHFNPELTGLKRRPVGQTCPFILQLPVDYDSYPEFRTEFDKILEAGVWDMEYA